MTLAILTSIVLLGQAGKSEQVKPSRPLPARYALLVGVGEYPLVPEWKLNGPPNDVRLWRELLVDRFKFPDDEQHIRALSDLTGRSRPELLPTRGNIEREIKALAKVLKRGDILFILLSGHGSQQPADFGRAGNYEPDGADEVFLTRDTNRYIREPGKPKGSFPNAIVDDDLREWVDPLVGDQTGALVWIVMDCCHSGTGLRGERPRNPTVGTMPEAERVAAQQEARQRYRENEKKEVAFSILPESPRVAAIFACEPDDTTPEMIMVGDDWYGLLSHTLRQAMEKEPEGSKPTCLTLDVRFVSP